MPFVALVLPGWWVKMRLVRQRNIHPSIISHLPLGSRWGVAEATEQRQGYVRADHAHAGPIFRSTTDLMSLREKGAQTDTRQGREHATAERTSETRSDPGQPGRWDQRGKKKKILRSKIYLHHPRALKGLQILTENSTNAFVLYLFILFFFFFFTSVKKVTQKVANV